MHYRFKKLPVSTKRYEKAVGRIRSALGSYENIATDLFAISNSKVSANAVRRWFNDQSIPIEYALFLEELTFGEVAIGDFYPWLEGRV